MEKNPKQRSYSYLVTRSLKDEEFVATFLEVPGLSGLATTVREAILELNQALDAWVAAVQDDELPDAAFRVPMVIIDRSFLGREPLLESLSAVLPEELEPEEKHPGANTSGGIGSVATKSVRVGDKQVIHI
jgi:predicted RNase H-like HicB family nuclease